MNPALTDVMPGVSCMSCHAMCHVLCCQWCLKVGAFSLQIQLLDRESFGRRLCVRGEWGSEGAGGGLLVLTCCHLGGGGAGRLLQQGVTAGERESEGGNEWMWCFESNWCGWGMGWGGSVIRVTWSVLPAWWEVGSGLVEWPDRLRSGRANGNPDHNCRFSPILRFQFFTAAGAYTVFYIQMTTQPSKLQLSSF